MATTLAQVGEFLNQRGWRYHQEPERNRIITGVNSEHASETGTQATISASSPKLG